MAGQAAAKKPIKILFVGGYGRSGSTVLDLLLDRVPGITAVGEFRHLFGRALGDNELCSCGLPFHECTYWTKIIAVAFPQGYDREQIRKAVKTFNTITRVPQLQRPTLMTPALKRQAKIYAEAYLAVYRAIATVSGASVIVDSSKYPMHGLFLQTQPDIDLKTMLLVRDPRAVAYSWQRHRVRPEVHWETREMPRHAVIRSALAWNTANKLTQMIGNDHQTFRLQRYEDFIDDPINTIQDIASFAQGKKVTLDQSIFDHQLTAPHTVAGNPARLGGEHIAVQTDKEWETQLGSIKKKIVATCCARQMRHFGYRPAASTAILHSQ